MCAREQCVAELAEEGGLRVARLLCEPVFAGGLRLAVAAGIQRAEAREQTEVVSVCDVRARCRERRAEPRAHLHAAHHRLYHGHEGVQAYALHAWAAA